VAGAFIQGGYYLKINKFIDADPGLQAVFKDMHPAVVDAYSSYPYKSKNFYGFPQMPDVIISYYRKDIFCNADEQKNFQAKYATSCLHARGMDNTDWKMFGDYGEFFQRKAGDKLAGETLTDDFYGIAYQAGKDYDFSSIRSTASSGSMAPTSGTRPRRPMPMPRAWSTRRPPSRRSITTCRC